jgi:hypothetical protein
MSREVVRRVGEDRAEVIMRKAVRRYAAQRGRRMAMRAQANGQALTMNHYRLYGEWRHTEPDASEAETVEQVPHLKQHVLKCPWHTAWQDNDLLPFGRFYCLEVDEALVQGFNPALTLEVNSTKTNGAEVCEFVFHDADAAALEAELPQHREQYRIGEATVMSWEYHTGHLYKTVGEVIVDELGATGQEAVAAALVEFGNRYGDEAARIVKAYQSTDFDQLPEG